MAAPFFDEIAHLAVVGGGFLRTPFLHATNPIPDRPMPGDCVPIDGSIVHIPAAYRRSTLALHDPPFRRVMLTSAFGKQVTYDQSMQSNQESSGVVFRFHDDPNRNLARVFINEETTIFGQRALIIDTHPSLPVLTKPADINGVGTAVGDAANMPVGFVAFLNRFWSNQRHIDSDIMLAGVMPLQFDVDWNVIHQMGNLSTGATFRIPVWGNVGDVKVWDSRLGRDTYDVSNSPILGTAGPGDTSGGTVKALQDGNGGWYLEGTIVETPMDSIPLVIQDDAGQFYSRSIAVVDAYPTPPVMILPSGRVGTPFSLSLPPENGFFNYIAESLPAGVSFDHETFTVSGTPETYGGNFSITAEIIDLTGEKADIAFIFAVNRAPRTLLAIVDTEGNDHHTGEVYECRFMPYGTMLVYAGTAYEFRRGLSTTQWWPGVHTVPYVYGHAGRRGAIEAEAFWRTTGAVPASP